MLKQVAPSVVIFLLFLTALPPVCAQLYVITGSPTPQRNENFGAALVRVGGDSSVSRTASLFSTDFNAGLAWIGLSQEARQAVLIPHGAGPARFVVVDFDAAAVVKTCDFPALPMPSLYDRLVELPGRGMVLAKEMFSDGHEKLAGMLLDKAITCDSSFVDMAPSDILGLRVHGRSGVSDTGSSDEMTVQVDDAGRVTKHILGVSFPFAVPEAMLAGMRNPIASILVDNSSIVAVGLFEKAASHRILVYRKLDQTWRRLPIPTDRVLTAGGQSTPTPWLTGFGNYLALTEARAKDPQNPETAGKGTWRTTRIETGPSIAERFREDEMVFPGRLHLYDMEHDRSFTIRTDQGDSEILLVEGGMVYYRVGDALFRASIGETELGPAQLIAKSEILGDAHWAFIRRP